MTRAETNCLRIVDELIEFGAKKGSVINEALLQKAICRVIGTDARTINNAKMAMLTLAYLKTKGDEYTLVKLSQDV